MNPPDDDLQNIWQKDRTKPAKGEYSTVLRLVQEKQHSLQDFLRGEDMISYWIALSFAPLTAFAMWKARSIPVMQVGYAVMTVTFVAGAIVTYLNHRRHRASLQPTVSSLEHQAQLLRVYEQEIRFSKGIKYWYSIPLFLGFTLAVYPIARHFFPQMWSILLVSTVFVALEYSVWRMHDVERVADLQRRKDEVQKLLDEMACG